MADVSDGYRVLGDTPTGAEERADGETGEQGEKEKFFEEDVVASGSPSGRKEEEAVVYDEEDDEELCGQGGQGGGVPGDHEEANCAVQEEERQSSAVGDLARQEQRFLGAGVGDAENRVRGDAGDTVVSRTTGRHSDASERAADPHESWGSGSGTDRPPLRERQTGAEEGCGSGSAGLSHEADELSVGQGPAGGQGVGKDFVRENGERGEAEEGKGVKKEGQEGTLAGGESEQGREGGDSPQKFEGEAEKKGCEDALGRRKKKKLNKKKFPFVPGTVPGPATTPRPMGPVVIRRKNESVRSDAAEFLQCEVSCDD